MSLPSGSSEEIRVGSNPVIRTKQRYPDFCRGIFVFYGASDEDLEPTPDLAEARTQTISEWSGERALCALHSGR